MRDDTSECERLKLAIRTGLLVEDQRAIRDALHCLDLARDYFGHGGATIDLLDAEPDFVAGDVAAGAARLAAVIGAVATELDDADAEDEARALRRARRAA